MRPRPTSPAPRRGSDEFPEVEVPDAVLRSARGLDAFSAVDVVEDYLRSVHGAMPDHRDDRERWLRWVEAVEERALSFLEDGLLAGRAPS